MRRHLTYANVVSSLCLFILLGGSAVAASKLVLPKSSVGTKQIRKHAVTKAKLAPKLVRALKGAAGPTGPQGVQGLQGERGAQGQIGPAGPTFGDVAVAGSSYNNHGCTDIVPVSKTITLDHRGPLYVLSQGSFAPNGNAGNGQTSNQVVLHKPGDASPLATTPLQYAYAHAPDVNGGSFTTGGIMTDGGNRFVAEPGTYVLDLRVFAYGTCAPTNLGIVNPGLSVIQLGS